MSQEKAAKEDLISDPVEATTDANLINNPAGILTIAICKGFSKNVSKFEKWVPHDLSAENCI